MTNLIIREWLNAALIPLNLALVITIGRMLFFEWLDYGHGWTKRPGIAASCAFFWVFVADAMRSMMAWYLLHAQNAGTQPAAHYLTPTITFIYITIATIGALATARLVYVLGPDEWGHKGWISAGIAAILTVTILQSL